MAFADVLGRPALGRFWYVLISGIPYVFSTVAAPSGWSLSYGGDTYQWRRNLLLDGLDRTSYRSKLNDPIVVGSSISLYFMIQGTTRVVDEATRFGVWHGLTIPRGDRDDAFWTYLRSSLEPQETSAIVSDISQTSGTGYLGLETLSWAGVSSTPSKTLTTMGRGKYGSQALYHRVSDPSATEAGGYPRITTWPRVWRGRYLTLAIGLGQVRGGGALTGSITPYGTSILSSADKQKLFVIEDVQIVDDKMVRIDCVSQEGPDLARQVAVNLPQARAGLGSVGPLDGPDSPYGPRIALDAARAALSWGYSWDNVAGAYYLNSVTRLQKRNAAGTDVENVAYATPYEISQISEFIADTIRFGEQPEAGGDAVERPSWALGARLTKRVENMSERSFKLRLEILTSIQPADATDVSGSPYLVGGGLWDYLGFGDGSGASIWPERELDGDGFLVFVFVAQRLFPWLWIPPEGSDAHDAFMLHIDRQYTDDVRPNPTAAPGMVDANGDAVGGYFRLGESEVFGASSLTLGDGVGADAQTVISVGDRFVLGSNPDPKDGGALRIDYKGAQTKHPMITQGLCYPGTSELEVALYLMLHGSGRAGFNHATYDYPPWFGPYIDADRVDIAGIQALDARQGIGPRSGWALFEPEDLRSILGEMAIRGRFRWVSKDGKLTAITIAPPLAHEAVSATLLDGSNLVLSQCRVVTSEADIVNQLDARVGYDPARKKFSTSVLVRGSASCAEWSARDPLKIDWRGESDWQRSSEELVSLAQGLFLELDSSIRLIEVAVASTIGWGIEPGDLVRLSHPGIVGRSQLRRGLSELACRVLDAEHVWRPGKRGIAARLLLLARDGERESDHAWAPSLLLSSGSGTTWQAAGHGYSAASAANDWTYWAAGMAAWAYMPGREVAASPFEVEVSSISGGGSVVLDTSLAGFSAPVVLKFREYSHSDLTATQRLYAYGSDGDGTLTGPAGDLPAHRWA